MFQIQQTGYVRDAVQYLVLSERSDWPVLTEAPNANRAIDGQSRCPEIRHVESGFRWTNPYAIARANRRWRAGT